jgi:glycine/D-amino acid oxidase-like deaminating enzyme
MTHSPPTESFDAVVVGGGFYGARLALALRARYARVLLVEREATLLSRASLINQARVHNGYHYPRSILTSLRSRINYSRFLSEYGECADRAFPHYYAIARGMSKITAAQFAEFCRRIEAPFKPVSKDIRSLFDAHRIDAVFEVDECAFDAVKLRARMTADLAHAGVEVALSTEATACELATDGTTAVVTIRTPDARRPTLDARRIAAPLVINATYSRLNELLTHSGASAIPVKLELAEMALLEPPPELAGAAVTVMDGPFFSLMPYPSRGLHTLSHVRYTPHCSWQGTDVDADAVLAEPRESRFAHMVRDAARFVPALRASQYVESLWEIKALMPRSEQDDSRPILLRRSAEVPACISVLGAKIDSVYDVEDALESMLWPGASRRMPLRRPTPGRSSFAIS